MIFENTMMKLNDLGHIKIVFITKGNSCFILVLFFFTNYHHMNL